MVASKRSKAASSSRRAATSTSGSSARGRSKSSGRKTTTAGRKTGRRTGSASRSRSARSGRKAAPSARTRSTGRKAAPSARSRSAGSKKSASKSRSSPQPRERSVSAAKPKRAITAFQAFVGSQLKNKSYDKKGFADAMKELGTRWKAMSDAEKAKYKTMATKAAHKTSKATGSGSKASTSKNRS